MDFRALIDEALKLAQKYAPFITITTDFIKGIALALAERENAQLPAGQQVTREQLTAQLNEIVVDSQAIIDAAVADQARAKADADAERRDPGFPVPGAGN
jgi:hypothetical protein